MTPPIASVVKAKLRAEGRFVLTLRGRCMEPLLFKGDRAAVFPYEHPQLGDLALILLDDDLLAVHRIVGFELGAFITKGDYSGKAEKVMQSRILGVAKKFSLEGGPWVEDPRSRNEIIDLVSLSLTIGHIVAGSSNSNARCLIWRQNESTRAAMMKGAEYVDGKHEHKASTAHYQPAKCLT